jgi:hypothetical protein
LPIQKIQRKKGFGIRPQTSMLSNCNAAAKYCKFLQERVLYLGQYGAGYIRNKGFYLGKGILLRKSSPFDQFVI